jgi:hypothetical protein
MATSIEDLEQRITQIEQTLDEILSTLQSMASGTVESGNEEAIEMSSDELDGIADALDKMERELTGRQRAYLLGLFGAAAHHLEQIAGAEGTTTHDVRKLVIRNPDSLGRMKLGDVFGSLTKVEHGGLGDPLGPLADSVGVGVGVACVGVDWSKDLDSQLNRGMWRTNPAFGGRLSRPGGGLGGLPGGFGR